MAMFTPVDDGVLTELFHSSFRDRPGQWEHEFGEGSRGPANQVAPRPGVPKGLCHHRQHVLHYSSTLRHAHRPKLTHFQDHHQGNQETQRHLIKSKVGTNCS